MSLLLFVFVNCSYISGSFCFIQYKMWPKHQLRWEWGHGIPIYAFLSPPSLFQSSTLAVTFWILLKRSRQSVLYIWHPVLKFLIWVFVNFMNSFLLLFLGTSVISANANLLINLLHIFPLVALIDLLTHERLHCHTFLFIDPTNYEVTNIQSYCLNQFRSITCAIIQLRVPKKFSGLSFILSRLLARFHFHNPSAE